MHDIKWIRDNPDAFKRGLKRRGLDGDSVLESLLRLDVGRRANIAQVQQWQEERNRKSKEIGKAKAAGDEAKASALMAEVSRLKSDIAKAGEEVSDDSSEELVQKLAEIPNLPLDDAPDGKDANDNVEHHHFGAKRTYSFVPKQHFDLGEALGQMDFETAAKLSGARFVVLKGGLARLERALSQFMLDIHTGEHGYTEVNPPLLVRDDTMFGTAQLPKFAEDQFSAARELTLQEQFKVREQTLNEILSEEERAFVDSPFDDEENLTLTREEIILARTVLEKMKTARLVAPRSEKLWLIPTAEVPLTNLVRESIVDEAQLPMRLTACTPCFRAEAGAAGKDTRGMIRQHQFTKVELVSITTPEQSKDEHERMLSCAEEVLRRLDLHYRVVTLCTGDMGFAAQKTYDIEVWLPGQNMFREISSCSVCGEFQARRMDARYRPKGGNPRHLHTLNGSGVAVGRALIAVMETYQQENGAIAVPDVLQSYMGGMKTIERR